MTINELISNFYSEEAKESKIAFSFANLDHNEPCPFTKFNSYLIDYAEEHGANRMIFRYPASGEFVFSLVFFRTIDNLVTGKSITQQFNANTFSPGQKVKIGNAFAQFEGFFHGERDGRGSISFNEAKISSDINYICLKFSSRGRGENHRSYYLIKDIPFIEPVSEKQKLSTHQEFEEQRSSTLQKNIFKESTDPVDTLRFKKASRCETAFLVTDVNRYKDLISTFTINGVPFLSLANVSYVNRNGKLISLNGGEHTYPQIVLANSIDDAYSVISDQEVNDLSYKYIYVDLNFCSDFDEDLDVIDDLICRGISL